MAYTSSTNPLAGTMPTGGELGSEMRYSMARGRRQAIEAAFRGAGVRKHGLIHAPMIQHPRNGKTSFVSGSEYKAGGY